MVLLIKRLLTCIFVIYWQPIAYASDSAVSPSPYAIFSFGNFAVTNGMIYTWIISIAIILAIKLLIGRPKLIPSRWQVVMEVTVEAVNGVIEPIVGRKVSKAVFPLLVGLFIYILFQNWSSLLPGVGTIGTYDASGHFLYFFRPSNADLNATLALAIVSFLAWVFCIMKYAGIKEVIWHIFGNKADRKEVSFGIYSFMFVIFLGVGFIECISILFRLVSLSFRLYGNVFGGENLLTNIMSLAPWTKFIVPVPFYMLEILIGAIQAFVFTLLCAVYIGLICNHEEDH